MSGPQERRASSAEPTGSTVPSDASQRIAELESQVAQLQSELRAATSQCETSRDDRELLRLSLEGTEFGIWDWDLVTGEVTFIRHWAEILGYPADEIRGHQQMWDDCVHPDDKDAVEEALEELLEGRADRFESEQRRRDHAGRWRWILDRGRVVQRDAEGRAMRAVGVHKDVTPRKQTEQALWDNELRVRAAFEHAALGLAMADAQEAGLIIESNLALQRMLGCGPGSLVGRRFHELVHPRDAEKFDQLWNELMAGQRPSFRLEVRFPRDGQADLPARVTMSPVHNSYGKTTYMLAIVEDITERHEAERRARAEQRLLRRILELNDKERRLLAYEIHDGLVQDLVAVKMVLEVQAEREGRTPGRGRAPVVSPLRVLGRAIAEGRRLISDLRPMIIEELGLIEALNYLVQETLSERSLEVSFEHRVDFERLPELLEGTLYRIVQEALNNVRRHAATDQVALTLRQAGSQLELTIEDQGRGFELAAVPGERFGLRGIRERARLFGGHATITSRVGQGTRIHVVMPLDLPLDDPQQDLPDLA